MRILVSDYSGHPFQLQLSRQLSTMGHDVAHVFFAGFQTPKGNLTRRDDDPPGFSIHAINLKEVFRKQGFLKRRAQEIEVGESIGRLIEKYCPDLVLSANAPLDTQRSIYRASRRAGSTFVFWVQDLYSEAIKLILHKKFGLLGLQIGWFYKKLEKQLLQSSDLIIAISDRFKEHIVEHGVSTRTEVIENWAPLDEFQPLKEVVRNSEGPFRFVYAGTLGYKHDPHLLFLLAKETDAEVHVYSEGAGADYLRHLGASLPEGKLVISKWVPFEDLGKTLFNADALVAFINADAGRYSVPSKVLSYLCVGKPLLLAVPEDNLAARIIISEKAGLVISPGQDRQFLDKARWLMAASGECVRMGANGRAYAERAFNIQEIAAKFEAAFQTARQHAELSRSPVLWPGARLKAPLGIKFRRSRDIVL